MKTNSNSTFTSPKHPCIGCIYFNACGERSRTMPCKGRMTRTEQKRENASANKKG